MFIDLTLALQPKTIEKYEKQSALDKPEIDIDTLKKVLAGHFGTHLDNMKKAFPLEYFQRKAVVFDVHHVKGRDIGISDIDFAKIKKDMCIVFYTGCAEELGYGNAKYFQDHPQLSKELIDKLLDCKISLIAIDAAGIRRAKEHTPTDQMCADNNVFVIENICNLQALLENSKNGEFIANTYPANYIDVTGLQCRMVAQI
ncbi:MAG: cyclase family protein [Elusimicrobiota bacterium]|jgi:kynurenine formamidase|nr:cyclase family protein [Elusimicrobiota bacterium]